MKEKVFNRSHITDGFAQKATVEVIVNIRSRVANITPMALVSPTAAKVRRQAIRAAQQNVLDNGFGIGIKAKHRYENILAFSAEVTEDGLALLEALPDVASIEPVYMLEPHLAQGIPLMGGATYRSTYTGTGMSIAICDTGVDYTHARLGGGGFPNIKVIGGYDTGDGDADPMPSSQAHGTACAGIAAGDLGTVGDYIGGVAYNARIYALKMTPGSDGSASSSAMIAAWDWCVTHWNDDPNSPIKVISTSFGGGRYYTACDTASPSMTAAANNAVAVGITVVCSSGNDGYCDSMGWPACISSVISVGAVYDANFGMYYPCISGDSCAPKTASGSCSSGYYASDSTAADLVTSYANIASFLTLHAPANRCHTLDIVGASGYSSGDYHTSFGGTSTACPYTAGAAACLQEAAIAIIGRYLTPGEVKALLTTYGDDVTDPKVAITKPRVNLEQAIDSLSGGSMPFDLPYTESFETDLGNWVNAMGDDGNWTRGTGATPSPSTGPDGTTNGTYYIYTEASTGADPGNPDKTANLELDVDLSGIATPQITFMYHMYGANMGSLSVDVFDGIWHNAIWSMSGQQHVSGATPWTEAQVDLSAYGGLSNVTLRLRGVTGNEYRSDMAVDFITVEAVGSVLRTLSINSIYGNADPPVGTNTYTSGTNITCSITNSPAEFTDSVSWKSCICTGWVGTGSVPATGSTTNTGSFALNEDSTITWLWAIQDLVLSNQVENATTNYTALETITARDGYTAETPGDITFEAGTTIKLEPGFTTRTGSVFRAGIDTGM